MQNIVIKQKAKEILKINNVSNKNYERAKKMRLIVRRISPKK